MGADEDLSASLAHLALACVAGPLLAKVPEKSFTHPGVFENFIVHGILGAMHHQGQKFGDLSKLYQISLQATKYLPLPCLMADVYRDKQKLRGAHLLSGFLPLALALAGNDNVPLGNICVAGNIISLAYYSYEKDKQIGWAVVGCGLLAYFVSVNVNTKIVYPLTLAGMAYFIDRLADPCPLRWA